MNGSNSDTIPNILTGPLFSMCKINMYPCQIFNIMFKSVFINNIQQDAFKWQNVTGTRLACIRRRDSFSTEKHMAESTAGHQGRWIMIMSLHTHRSFIRCMDVDFNTKRVNKTAVFTYPNNEILEANSHFLWRVLWLVHFLPNADTPWNDCQQNITFFGFNRTKTF